MMMHALIRSLCHKMEINYLLSLPGENEKVFFYHVDSYFLLPCEKEALAIKIASYEFNVPK